MAWRPGKTIQDFFLTVPRPGRKVGLSAKVVCAFMFSLLLLKYLCSPYFFFNINWKSRLNQKKMILPRMPHYSWNSNSKGISREGAPSDHGSECNTWKRPQLRPSQVNQRKQVATPLDLRLPRCSRSIKLEEVQQVKNRKLPVLLLRFSRPFLSILPTQEMHYLRCNRPFK